MSRHVTLTGVGGCGKTRLALRMAEQTADGYRDGVCWVDLAPIGDAARVDEAVASALGVLNPQRPPREALLEFVAERRLLVVLDNCEHVLRAAGDSVDVLLAGSEGVHILGDEPRRIGRGGRAGLCRAVAVDSHRERRRATSTCLPHPMPFACSPSARRWCSPASRSQPRTDPSCSTSAGVCDGIPLAIELAAARTQLLSVEQIRGLLEDRLALLSGRGRAVPRHQTLGAALQWSYDLLTGEEQRTLRLLSVFQGGWTLSAATAVCGARVGGVEVLDLLWRLVEKSLVEVVHTEGSEARYRLLEMVRQFAFDRLFAAAEAPDAQLRHAAHFLGEFERAIPDLLGPREVETVAALERELDNLLVALNESTRLDGGAERVMRAASDGWLLWVSHGRIALGRDVLATALQCAEADTSGRARALMASSMLARFAGEGPKALAHAEASVALYEQLREADPSGLAFALFQRAAAETSFAGSRTRAVQDLERVWSSREAPSIA